LRTLVDIPAAPLLSALEAGGWRVASVEEPNVWWCRERWHLRSTWSPRDREAFLSFLVDPEYKIGAPNVFAVKASATPPTQWQSSPQENKLYFGRGWRRQIPELIAYLNGLRSQSAA
jgi:hypothetical protein